MPHTPCAAAMYHAHNLCKNLQKGVTMPNSSHTIRQELSYILIFIGVMWAVFFVSYFFPALNEFGIVPRTTSGMIGIPISIFLHQNIGHIFANTVPLFILLALLAGSKARSWEIVVYVTLLGGFLLWIFGRPAYHIGASGLIFGLISFLIVSGLLEGRIVPLLISLGVGFFYGGTLVTGVLPQLNSNVSWEGHLCGAIAGAAVAYYLTKEEKPAEDSAEELQQ
jgi:membrane associated rhomboid family serine protease